MPDNITAPSATATFPTPAPPRTSGTGKLELDSDAFLKLLVAQLKYQNPSNPMDPTAMMGQTAQLAVVDRIDQLLKAQETASQSSQISLGASLIGKSALYRVNGVEQVGVVDAVTITPTGISLVIAGSKVNLDDLVEVGPGPTIHSPSVNPTPPPDLSAGSDGPLR